MIISFKIAMTKKKKKNRKKSLLFFNGKMKKMKNSTIKCTFNGKHATPKPTKFTKSNIKWPSKVEFIFNERNIIPKPTNSTKSTQKWHR
jgi:hypothetical protein